MRERRGKHKFDFMMRVKMMAEVECKKTAVAMGHEVFVSLGESFTYYTHYTQYILYTLYKLYTLYTLYKLYTLYTLYTLYRYG